MLLPLRRFFSNVPGSIGTFSHIFPRIDYKMTLLFVSGVNLFPAINDSAVCFRC